MHEFTTTVSISTDPADLYPLIPGHFLIERPLIALLYSDVAVKTNRLSRFQAMQQHFWKWWQADYLS